MMEEYDDDDTSSSRSERNEENEQSRETNEKQVLITEPSEFDVLLGRGKSNKNWPGNRRFQAIVKANRERYFSVQSHHEKKAISSEIVKSVFKHGRFLKRDRASRNWIAVSTEVARIKVAHALQYRRRRLSKVKEPREKCTDHEDEEEYRLAMKFASKGHGNQLPQKVNAYAEIQTSESKQNNKSYLHQQEAQVAMQYAAAKGTQTTSMDLDPSSEAAMQILMTKNKLLNGSLAIGNQGQTTGLQSSTLLNGALLGQSQYSATLPTSLNLSQSATLADPTHNISRLMQIEALAGANIAELEQARNIASLALQFNENNPGNLTFDSASARLAALQYEASLLANNSQLSQESRAARIAAMQQTASANAERNALLQDNANNNLSEAFLMHSLATLRAIDQDAAVRLMLQSQLNKEHLLRAAALQYASLQAAAVSSNAVDEEKLSSARRNLLERPSVSIKYVLPDDTINAGDEEVTSGSTLSIKYDESNVPASHASGDSSGQAKDSPKHHLKLTSDVQQIKTQSKQNSMTKKTSSSLADWSSRQGFAKRPIPVSTSHKLSAESGGKSTPVPPVQTKKKESTSVVDAAVSLLLLTPSKAEDESD